MQVIINDLANLPHRDGQVVLKAERDDFEVEVRCRLDGYHVYGIAREPEGGKWTRLACPRSTPQQARDLAEELLRAAKTGIHKTAFRTRKARCCNELGRLRPQDYRSIAQVKL